MRALALLAAFVLGWYAHCYVLGDVAQVSRDARGKVFLYEGVSYRAPF